MARSYFELPLKRFAMLRPLEIGARPLDHSHQGGGDCIVAGSFDIHSCR
jgi:hypothetical protein